MLRSARAVVVLAVLGSLAGGLAGRALAATPDPTALAVLEDERVLHASHVALHHSVPFLVLGRVATLVLPGRSSPYRLPELARRVPQAVALAHGRAVIKAALLAMPGATLVLDSHDAGTVVLAGGPSYTSIVGLRATVLLKGHPGARLVLTSDGARSPYGARPYVASRGGTLQVDATDVRGLGFGLGRTSGVAWLGRDGAVRGGAVGSTFVGNHDGAFASHAPGLRFAHDTFATNESYGLELYGGSKHVLVTDSTATGNGRHGFLVSRDCDDDVLRRDAADRNAGGGFVIDDGQDSAAGDLGPASTGSSDRAQLADVSALGNGEVGIAVNGGSGTVVRRARIAGSRFGAWVEHGATGTRLDTVAVKDTKYAAVLVDQASSTTLHAVWASASQVGLLVRNSPDTAASGLQVAAVRVFGVRFVGRVQGSALTHSSLAGHGPRAVDLHRVTGARPHVGRDVVTTGWATTYHFSFQRWLRHHPTAWSWAPVVGVPLVMWLPRRRRRRGRFVLGRLPA